MPTLSIDMTNAQATRVSVAVGKLLNLGRDATAAEVRQFTIDRLKDAVLRAEKLQKAAEVDTVQPIDLT